MTYFTAELEQNGYAAMYKQNKNKPREDRPWYQVYTIKDYRKMQNEVRLSRAPLGPDLDNETYKEKVSKLIHIKKQSKNKWLDNKT